MLPVINAFKAAHQLSDVTVVADAGMISEANQVAMHLPGRAALSFAVLLRQNHGAQYTGVGGKNGHFDFPPSGDHGWSSWAPQLAAMSADLATTIR
jgi:S-formylglutathione hydrolase FrmB